MTQEEILHSPKFQMEAALIRKCSEDAEFRAKILADPKGMLQEALGQKLPENLEIVVHEEDLHTLHFSVPPSRESLAKELTDEQLEQIAGGTELGLVVSLLGIGAILSASVAGTAAVAGTVVGAVIAKTVKW
jgi:hypothetical protein